MKKILMMNADVQDEARRLEALYNESNAKCKELSDEKHQGKVLEEKIKRCENKIADSKKEVQNS
jgi:peptidoglycan hydrolase CwlO-like protein